jgi:hypothetical protein
VVTFQTCRVYLLAILSHANRTQSARHVEEIRAFSELFSSSLEGSEIAILIVQKDVIWGHPTYHKHFEYCTLTSLYQAADISDPVKSEEGKRASFDWLERSTQRIILDRKKVV